MSDLLLILGGTAAAVVLAKPRPPTAPPPIAEEDTPLKSAADKAGQATTAAISGLGEMGEELAQGDIGGVAREGFETAAQVAHQLFGDIGDGVVDSYVGQKIRALMNWLD